MIRDFWRVKKGTLFQEVEELKDTIDPVTWQAMDAVRSVGNIGAHMERDVNAIVDVQPGEAEQLIVLVETLLNEWYVARHEREKRMKAVVDLAAQKKAEQKDRASGGA